MSERKRQLHTLSLAGQSSSPSEAPVVKHELDAINTENQSYGFQDLFAASNRDFNKDRQAFKYQELLQIFQSLVEQRFPAEIGQNRYTGTLIKASAARQVKIVQCDGICYSWLASWLQKASNSRQVWMVEAVMPSRAAAHHAGEHPNHYFLLVSNQDEAIGLEVGKAFAAKLLKSKPDPTLTLLESRNIWLVDPALNRSMPMTSQNFREHLDHCSRYYDYPFNQNVQLEIVDHFNKISLPSGAINESELQARRLLLMASFRSHDPDLEHRQKLGRTIDWLHEQRITCDQLYPDLFRSQLLWCTACLYCALSLDLDTDVGQMLQEQGRPNNIDRIFCFRPDTDRYFEALREEIIDMLRKGIPPEMCLEQLDHPDCFKVSHLKHCQPDLPARIATQNPEATSW